MQQTSLHRSPGLTAVYNALKSNTRNHVLDLGDALASNFSFFSQLGCHFHFENFPHLLCDAKESNGALVGDWETRFLQHIKPEQRFDVVLIWDLFNFVPLATQQQIFQKILQHIKPNTLIYMMSYVGAQRPANPATFKIVDRHYIDVECAPYQAKNETQLTTMQLLKSFPNCQMLRSYLNLEGMLGGISEKILCYEPQSKSTKEVFSNAEVTQVVRINKEIRSPALETMRQLANTREKLSVLDLGGRNLQNEEQLKARFHSVYTADFRQVLQRLTKMEPQAQLEYLKNGPFLGFAAAQKFDVILAWDFLNYFNDEQLQALGERLAGLVNNSSLLMCINYNSSTIPAQPRQYSITRSGIGFHDSGNEPTRERSWTPLNSLKVQKILPGFFIKNAFTVQQGMLRGTSEYILVYKDIATLSKEKADLYAQVMERKRLRELQQREEEAAET